MTHRHPPGHKLFVTLPYFGRMRGIGPTGNVTYHKILQNPAERTPFYVLMNEATGEILVFDKDQIVVHSSHDEVIPDDQA